MPAVTGDHGRVAQTQVRATVFKFFDGAIENFALRFHAFAIAGIEVLRKTPRFIFILGIEQFDNCRRGIHPPGGVNSWPNAKAKVVGSHFAVIAASSDIHKRA